MFRDAIRRAIKDTKATVRRHITGTLSWLVLSAIGSSLGYYTFFGRAVLITEWQTWVASAVGPLIAATTFFLFHLIMAPYRLLSERAEAAEARACAIEKLAPIAQRDWPISSLFQYLRPDIRRDDQSAWKDTLQRVEDAFSTGRLAVWGRRGLPEGRSGSLELIEASYWKEADLIGWAVDPRWQNGRHTDLRRFAASGGWRYHDLHVDEQSAKLMWPHALAPARVIEGDTRLAEAALYVDTGRWDVRPGDPAETVMPGVERALETIQHWLTEGRLQCWARPAPAVCDLVEVEQDYWRNGYLSLDMLLSEYPRTCRRDAQSGAALYDPHVSSLQIEAMRDELSTSLRSTGSAAEPPRSQSAVGSR